MADQSQVPQTIVVTQKRGLSCFSVGCLAIIGVGVLVFFIFPFLMGYFGDAKTEKLFEENREEIISEIQTAIASENYDLAYRIAHPYRGADDFELKKLWAKVEIEMEKIRDAETKEREAEQEEKMNDPEYKARQAEIEARQEALADAVLSRIRGGNDANSEGAEADDKSTGSSIVDGMKIIVNEANKAEVRRNASFQKDKDKIISSISAAIEAGDYDLAFNLAEPYSAVDDFEFKKLWAIIITQRNGGN